MLVDCDSMRVKIIDFGCSKLLLPRELQQSVAGTPEFMAPEVVNFEGINTQTGHKYPQFSLNPHFYLNDKEWWKSKVDVTSIKASVPKNQGTILDLHLLVVSPGQ